MKRFIDFCFAVLLLFLLLPLFVVISLLILAETGAPVLFVQARVGKGYKEFPLFKFRSMALLDCSPAEPQITVASDPRITRVGSFLRKTKLDELPQLLNIICGQMSFVGPRPEVPRYVSLYSPCQRRILDVRPGLTDYASIKYRNESALLAKSQDPELFYVEYILPDKLSLSLRYIDCKSPIKDLVVILRTIKALFFYK